MSTKYVLPAKLVTVVEFGTEASDKLVIAALQHDAQVLEDCLNLKNATKDSKKEDLDMLKAFYKIIRYYGGKVEE